MARIILTADTPAADGAAVLLEESVRPVHLSDEHSARQLLERLSWALSDATGPQPSESTGRPAARSASGSDT
jgi:hypothetical protein